MKHVIKKALKFTTLTVPVGLLAGLLSAIYLLESMNAVRKSELLSQTNQGTFYAVTAIQTGLLYGGILAFLGYILSYKIGLIRPFTLKKRSSIISMIAGLLCGTFIILSDAFGFAAISTTIKQAVFVKGAVTPLTIASSILYGGIIEEIMMRLFLMSLFGFVFWKLFARKSGKEAIPMWIFVNANVLSALLFAAGHIPATIGIFGALSPLLLIRCFLLNGIGGILFGELYRRYGIQYAMLAHIFAHIAMKTLQFLIIG